MPALTRTALPRRPSAPLIAALAALPLLAAGCAGTPGPAAAHAMAPPAITEPPVLTQVADRSLPVETYLLSGAQYRQLSAAEDVLVGQCMQDFGLPYERPPAPDAAPTGQTTHRYDPVDPQVAAAHGYHPADPNAGAKPAEPSISPDAATVLGAGAGAGPSASATPRSYRGKAVPPGGCLGQAHARLTAHGGTGRDPDLVVGINFGGYQQSTTDPRVKDVFQKWSACMKAKGFGYATPADAAKDTRWKSAPQPTPDELATATADVACKAATNVVGVWYTVESAYEAQAIQQKLPELTRIKQDNDAMLAIARSVTDTGH
ncbi:hypothetical protein [Kitasatospora sp. NPDC089509]|uniref:hypothetical protein n=1 Tax=Kitasatospora sp. NPDC089509 TaxID=3364079 RepID=UPI003814D8C3